MSVYRVYQKKVNGKGEAPVYVGFYLNREKIEIPTKISLPPEFFDCKKGIVKSTYDYANDKNLIISDIKAAINDILVRYRLRKERLTTERFLIEYRNPGKYQSFFDFCRSYQRLRFQEVTIGTQKKHRACLGLMKSFKEEVLFDELTPDFFRKFILYLRNRRGNSEVTINKTIGVISVYLNDAVKKSILNENPVHSLKLRGSQETKAEALTAQELESLVGLFNSKSLFDTCQKVLEFFLFMCFSSLHISDAKALTIEQIGKDELLYMRAKMLNIRPRVVRVPISDPLRKIINNQRRGRSKGRLWDNIIADQKINKYLKIIAQEVGITKNLSAKVGRHTFATIFLRRTRDLNALKDIMGHSNIKQTLVYAHVIDQDRKEGIKIFNDFNL